MGASVVISGTWYYMHCWKKALTINALITYLALEEVLMSGSGTVSFLPTRSGALASVVTPRGGEEPRRRKQSDPSSEIKALLEDYPYQELAVEFDQHERVLWYFMAPAARPSATIGLMEDIKHLQGTVRNLFTHYQNATEQPVKYMVLGSRMPGIFNLGGDLALFGKLIADRDRKALVQGESYNRILTGR